MPRFEDHREHVEAIIAAVRRGSDPRACTAAAVRREPPRGRKLAVIAVGKAAPAMLAGFREASPTAHDAVVVVPLGVDAPAGAIVADHPLPTRRSVRAAERVADFVRASASGAGGHDGFVVLLSGGASSLLAWPAAGLDLEEYAAAMASLLRSGLDIRELNTVRKHCERLKGGQLAAMMGGLPCDTYILSDVVGDDLSSVGSGPTVGDPTTFAEARDLVAGPRGADEARRVLLPRLEAGARGEIPETPKPADPRLAGVRAVVVGSNAMAVEAAAAEARGLGFANVLTRTGVVGPAAGVGRELAAAAAGMEGPGAVIWGGETTVEVGRAGGKGGRNQEVALAAAVALEGTPGVVVATFGTDGVDGPTDAAGAVATGETAGRARACGIDPHECLANHDSYSLFDRLGDMIRTGPTGTNVNDVALALVYPAGAGR